MIAHRQVGGSADRLLAQEGGPGQVLLRVGGHGRIVGNGEAARCRGTADGISAADGEAGLLIDRGRAADAVPRGRPGQVGA